MRLAVGERLEGILRSPDYRGIDGARLKSASSDWSRSWHSFFIETMLTEPTTMNTSTPRMEMVWSVLDGAKDAGDQVVIAACRRLIEANRLGWRKYAQAADIATVKAFAV